MLTEAKVLIQRRPHDMQERKTAGTQERCILPKENRLRTVYSWEVQTTFILFELPP